jgi:hypothetical protein
VNPYILFVVRPDGIRSFYEARSRVEELGMPYGYELVTQDEAIEYPAVNDPTIWGEISAIRERGLAELRDPPRETLSQAIAAAERGEPMTPAGFPPSPPTARGINVPRSLDDLIAADPGLTEAFRAQHGLESLSDQANNLEELHGTRSGTPGSQTVIGAVAPQGEPNGHGSSGGNDDGPAGRPRGDGQASPVDQPPADQFNQASHSSPEANPSNGPAQSSGAAARQSAGSASGGGSSSLGGMTHDEMLEITIVCTRRGAIIQPGAYRLTKDMLKKQPDRLTQTLRSLVTARERAMPGKLIWPTLSFLVEPTGEEIYWSVRGKIATDLPEWPTEWHVAEPQSFSLFGSERW